MSLSIDNYIAIEPSTPNYIPYCFTEDMDIVTVDQVLCLWFKEMDYRKQENSNENRKR